jgi:prophage tail gpP-like protein
MLWDSPDGRLVVGEPDDEQRPLYSFRMYGDSRRNQNNILSASRAKDWSGVPSTIFVAGTGHKQGWSKAQVRGFAQQAELIAAGLYRPVLIINEGLKNDANALSQAQREMTGRIQRMDTWTIKVDGLSYWDGSQRIPYGVDTVCEIDSTAAGGPSGAYLVHRVSMSRSANDGDTTELTVLKRGLWRL